MTYAQLKNVLEENQLDVAVDGAELVLRGPSAALTSELKAAVRHHRQTLVDELSAAAPFEADPDNRYQPFPLTEIQQAYWLGRNSLFELGGVGIHVYEELDCLELDEERLEKAWQRVIDRHDMLRSVVCAEGMQRVLPEAQYRFERVDLTALPAREQTQCLENWRERLSHKVYAPEQWPLFDFVVCRISSRLSRLLISMDAIHIDMKSFQLLFRDWVRAYQEPDRQWPAVSITYRDYALALNRLQDSAAYQRDWKYWSTVAAELPPAPELPFERPLQFIRGHRFERRRGTLGANEWRLLKGLAASAGLTPSGITLAAYAEVLGRWITQPAFTINSTLFNALPLHPEVGRLAGDFTSMLLIEVDGGAGAAVSFRDRARALQARLVTGLEHRLVSGIRVLREYARRHSLPPHRAVFPVVFTSTLNENTRGLEPLEQLGNRVFGSIQTPQVLLDLQVSESQGALVFQFDAVEGLFPEGCLDAMQAAWLELLTALARGERWHLSDALPIEYPQRIPPEATLPVPTDTLFAFCWSGSHDRDAAALIESNGRHWTRSAVFERVSSLAALLVRRGIRAGEPIAILMPKGPLQFIAAHGIVAAGGVYLPLDPDWPPARIASISRDSGCRFVVSDRPGRAAAATNLEEIQPPPAGREGFAAAIDPQQLAYVLYTSGSTGSPKGVMIEQRSIVNRFTDVLSRFAIGSSDRIFALTALHHDLSVFDLFGSFASGASVLIPDSARLRDPEHWAELIEREGVTVWNSVPALLEMFVEDLESRSTPPRFSIRLFLIAGDWIPVDLPDRIRRLWPEARFISLGGPTETTVWDICHPVEQSYVGQRSIPYGKPMRGARYFAMDANGVERPDWVAGELWIGGHGLARGYWGDEDKTRERFVTHPKTGERLFRSGDLGRFRPDGTIEFMGRTDHQLKIRGARIEAGEVERALTAHPGVDRAIVQAIGEQTESKRLVAFVIRSSTPDRSEDLAEHWRLRSENRTRWDVRESAGSVDLMGCSRATNLACDRHSHRRFHGPVEMTALASLLETLSGFSEGEENRCEVATELIRFRYPSAGSLYPVDVYLQIPPDRVEGLKSGVYRYHPWRQRLSLVSNDRVPTEAHVEHNRCMTDSSAFLILFVGHLPAIEPRYGRKSRDYCLLEAGHMSQLLMLEASVHGLGLCPIGDIDERAVRAALRLESGDLFLQAMAGGKPAMTGSRSSPAEDWREELARHLRTTLPEAMIPDQWVELDRLPLTRNGKLDRGALAERARQSIAGGRDSGVDEAPENQLEEALARIVAATLGVDKASVNTRFFEMGCDSIQLVRIFAQIRNEGSAISPSQSIRMTDLFEFPTVRLLARRLASMQCAASGDCVNETVASAEARGRARVRTRHGRE